jgi:hypothetical protein
MNNILHKQKNKCLFLLAFLRSGSMMFLCEAKGTIMYLSYKRKNGMKNAKTYEKSNTLQPFILFVYAFTSFTSLFVSSP